MIIGGLFGSITNKYITDSLLPINNTWNLSDKIHTLTIVYLLLLSIYSIYEQRKKLKDNFNQDVFVFLLITISYLNFYFLYYFLFFLIILLLKK
jgi:integral membrane sensor domain MASE1